MREKAISIVRAEWDALAGLPYLQVRLYLVLRWHMDVATRRTGLVRGISLQGLCEELFIEPAPGRQDSGSPTKKSVRSALEQLEKHGLIEPCGNGEVLAFLLPLSGSVSARSELKGHKRGTVIGHANGHGEMLASTDDSGDKGHAMGHGVNAVKGHTSEVRVNPLSVVAAAAPTRPVDKYSSGVLLLPLQPEMVASWLRMRERQRGRRATATAGDWRIATWIASGVTPTQLAEAYAMAVADRVANDSPAAINLGFLDVFVSRVLGSSRAARGGVASAPGGWWDSPSELHRLAEAAGIATRLSGEAFQDFQARVVKAVADGREVSRG